MRAVWAVGMWCLSGLAWADTPGIQTKRDIVYGKVGMRELQLHLLSPKPLPKAPAPLMVWIHGGGWAEGNHNDALPFLNRFVERGFIVASVGYRLTPEAGWPAQIEDCKCAVRYLRANAAKYHIDPQRIGTYGVSAGGHLSAMMALTGGMAEFEGKGGHADVSSAVQAAVDWCGPSDLVNWPEIRKPGWMNNLASKLLGGSVADRLETARHASPITYVRKDIPPLLIVHGDKDDLVPLKHSETLYDALKKKGAPVSLTVLKGDGHLFVRPQTLDEVADFLEKHLKK